MKDPNMQALMDELNKAHRRIDELTAKLEENQCKEVPNQELPNKYHFDAIAEISFQVTASGKNPDDAWNRVQTDPAIHAMIYRSAQPSDWKLGVLEARMMENNENEATQE